MNKEQAYTKEMPPEHIKAFGQYFTNYNVAQFMCNWACNKAKTVLDPAVGNSIFLRLARQNSDSQELTGFELDPEILKYFGNPANAHIVNQDYLLNDWDAKYDAIVCNPPYNRFQGVENRKIFLQEIEKHTGYKCSPYTNLYILFLLKSIYQLSESGRLAYIIPTEFLNSAYGTPIKKILLENTLVRAILNFENDNELFFNATTTSCILLVDKEPKKYIEFFNLPSVQALKTVQIDKDSLLSVKLPYAELKPAEKWRKYLHQENTQNYFNLTSISKFCSVSRGIATGANDYFCLSKSDLKNYNIPDSYVSKCICRSSDVKGPFFKETDFNNLVLQDKRVFLLDIKGSVSDIDTYINEGIKRGVNKRFLPSHRNPWYIMEQKKTAPIWVTSANRGGIKFIRNLAGIKSLTTFHSVYIHEEYEAYTDILFCYFLTPIAQTIIRENRKELGNGLDKFQPNDLNSAKMLDLSILSKSDLSAIKTACKELQQTFSGKQIDALNELFTSYLVKPQLLS